MPTYRYEGDAPCNVGGLEVKSGDTVTVSFSPGKRFTLIEESVLTGPQSVAPPLIEPLTEEAPGKSRRKGSE